VKKLLLLTVLLCSLNRYSAQREKAYFASGCFWCVEAIFETIPGVINASSGYAGGSVPNPSYEEVCSGKTGYAETVEVTFNKKSVSFEKLLEVFFNSHDPTTLNKQGPDVGTQYRSAVFYINEEQRKATEAFILGLLKENEFNKITTTVEKMKMFYPAENYHQDFVKNNPNHPYVMSVSNKRKQKFLNKYKKP
jgi:peptide-methionine (S)-S-oxide reductase